MTDAFVTVLGAALVSTGIPHLIRGRYPGLRTLCHWIVLANWLVGYLLGSSALLIGLHDVMGFRKAAALGAGVLVTVQLAVWLVFMVWLPDRRQENICDEHESIRGMTSLTETMARVVG